MQKVEKHKVAVKLTYACHLSVVLSHSHCFLVLLVLRF